LRVEASGRPPENRDATAARRPHDRLLSDDAAARRRSRCPCSRFSGGASCIRGSCRAGSRTPTRARTTSSAAASTARRWYTGVIEGIGPRYCPSIEDKIHRFAAKQSHQIFLEARRAHDQRVLPQRISTSLPFDVQVDLVQSIRGLENAHLLRPGYAIEYDYYDPRNLKVVARDENRSPDCSSPGRSNGTTVTRRRRRRAFLAGIQRGACW